MTSEDAAPAVAPDVPLQWKCDWCHELGFAEFGVEEIQTAGRKAHRCIDREACRGRAQLTRPLYQ